MKKRHINNEGGFVLITSLLMLVILTIIGISATNTTTVELQIAGNDKTQKMDFYVAESGWQHGVQWIKALDFPLGPVNTSIVDPNDPRDPNDPHDPNDPNKLIRNYGGTGDGVLNNNFATNPDGELTDRNIPYWFKVKKESKTIAKGNSADKGYGEVDNSHIYTYLVTATASGEKSIEVRYARKF